MVGGRNRSGVTYIWSIICPIWTLEAVVGARLNGKSRVMVRLRGPLTPLTRWYYYFSGPAMIWTAWPVRPPLVHWTEQ